MTNFLDLRQYLAAGEDHGELRKLSGAHWDLGMGAIVELIYREAKAPNSPRRAWSSTHAAT